MTVSSTTNRSGPYSGNGVTRSFPYTFRIFDPSHLIVVSTVSGVDSVVDAFAYSVTDVGNAAGGSIVFAVAPVIGTKITILRDAPFTQQTDLENQGAYYAETIEQALDLCAMRDQQLAEKMSRALLMPVGSVTPETGAALQQLAALLAGAGDVIGFSIIYQGVLASDPAKRRDGSPLQRNDFYFNSTLPALRFYNGTAWIGEGSVDDDEATWAGLPDKPQTALELGISELVTQTELEDYFASHGPSIAFQNVGTGLGVFKQFSGGVAQFKRILGGTAIEVIQSGDDLKLNYTGGGSGADQRYASALDAVLLGCDPTGQNDVGPILRAAIPQGAKGLTIIFPPGTYLFNSFHATGQNGLYLVPNALLNRQAWALLDCEDITILGFGAKFVYGPNLTNNGNYGYSTLGIATTPAGKTAGTFAKNIRVSGIHFRRERGNAQYNQSQPQFIGGFETHSVDGLTISDCRFSGFTDAREQSFIYPSSCYAGTLCKDVSIKRCIFENASTAFDISVHEGLVAEDNWFVGNELKSIYAINFFFDPVTAQASYDRTKDGMYSPVGSGYVFRGNRIHGFKAGITATTGKNVLVADNEITAPAGLNSNDNIWGIYAGTDAATNSLGQQMDHVKIRGNRVVGFKNAGPGVGYGVFLGNFGGSAVTKRIVYDGNFVNDNDVSVYRGSGVAKEDLLIGDNFWSSNNLLTAEDAANFTAIQLLTGETASAAPTLAVTGAGNDIGLVIQLKGATGLTVNNSTRTLIGAYHGNTYLNMGGVLRLVGVGLPDSAGAGSGFRLLVTPN